MEVVMDQKETCHEDEDLLPESKEHLFKKDPFTDTTTRKIGPQVDH